VSTVGGLTDAELMALVAQGYEPPLRELYERHAPWLSVRLMRRCHDEDLASQVLQDTFVAVWTSAPRWRADGEVAAWLWGIAFRRLVSQLRRPAWPLVAGAAADEPATESAEDRVLLAVGYGDAGTALAALSPELRAVIQLTVIDGLTEREAARLLGLPLGTTKSRARRARRALREHLVTGAAMEARA
jgi:RNA polymerase sigma factor (sigma-70 family)